MEESRAHNAAEHSMPAGDVHGIAPRQSRMVNIVQWAVILFLGVAAFILWRSTELDDLVDDVAEIGPIPAVVAISILPPLGFPTTPLFLLAGAAYGAGWAMLWCGLGVAGHLVLMYLLSRGSMRGMVKRLLLRLGYRLPVLEGRSAMRFMVVLKLAPGVPTFVSSYLGGIVGVSFGVYFAVSWLMTMLYAAGLVFIGDSLDEQNYVVAVVAMVGLGALSLAVNVAWRRLRTRRRAGRTLRQQPGLKENSPE